MACIAVAVIAATLPSVVFAQTPQAMAEYRRKLAEYTAVRQPFDEAASAYWTSISDKRRTRNAKRRNGETIVAEDYVLT